MYKKYPLGYRPKGGANGRLLYDVKLWSKSDIPTEIEFRILCHLASDPEARVYLDEYDDYGAGVSNGGGVPGWTTAGAVHHLRHGCHVNRRPWVWFDPKAPRVRGSRIKAYKISTAGFEAIAQYLARNRYEEAHLRLAKRLIEQGRRMANALKPKC